jgi:SAM-dependent methyltransferase
MDASSQPLLLELCPVCGHREFSFQKILWPELVQEWELRADEETYIDLQQGFRCTNCKNNLRCMTLAAAITRAFGFSGSLENFCRNDSRIRVLHVIEVNPSGTLSRYLELLPQYELHSFPQLDLQQMSFEDSSIDVMIHSDTLEHVPNSRSALKECRRVLKPEGRLFYTVPIVVGRLTRTRRGLPASYHGKPDLPRADYMVQTEYGADFWCEIFEAGFHEVTLTSLTFPASVAIAVSKARG